MGFRGSRVQIPPSRLRKWLCHRDLRKCAVVGLTAHVAFASTTQARGGRSLLPVSNLTESSTAFGGGDVF
jgi:hypothetical protein